MSEHVPGDRRDPERRDPRARRPLVVPPGRHLTRLERLLIGLVLTGMTIAAATVIIAGATWRNTQQINREQNERRNQTCLVLERLQVQGARTVRSRYAYLDSLKNRRRVDQIARTIVLLLPQTERDARAARAPAFCDQPGVGLAEPAPGACQHGLPACDQLPPHHDYTPLLRKPSP